MKFLSVLPVIFILLLQECEAVDPTTDSPTGNTTSGENSTAAGPCAAVICRPNSVCVASGNSASCPCLSGFIDLDGACVQGCEAIILAVSNVEVSQDVDCGQGNYTPSNTTLTVSFAAVAAGSSSVANISCNDACDNLPRQIGRVDCQAGGNFTVAIWTNCSSTREDQSSGELANNAASATSDPDATAPSAVDNALGSLEAAAEQSIDNEVASVVVQTIGNVFSSTVIATQTRVSESLTRIFVLIEIVQAQVTLTTTRDGAKSWEVEFRRIAICVVIEAPRQFRGSSFYYGPTNAFAIGNDGTVDLASSAMNLTTDTELPGPFISAATPSASARLNFSMYENTAFNGSSIPGLLEKSGTVYHCNMEIQCQMKFEITEELNVSSDNRYDMNNTENTYKELQGLKYNTTGQSWSQDTSCTDFSAEGGYARMKCMGEGVFTIAYASVEMTGGGSLGLASGGISGMLLSSLLASALMKLLHS